MRIVSPIMSIVEKVVGPLGRPPSAQAAKGLKAQSRGIQSYSTPVYKTQSETSILPKPPNVADKGPSTARRMSSNSGMKPVKTLDDVSNLLRNQGVKNVVVMAGAGISTPSGIPDFRTPGTGLYDNLQQYRIPYPEAIFDIEYFHHNPKPFFTLAKELFPSGKYRPNYIHYFLKNLYDKGMLLRMYTQNIDGLERLAGLPPDKLVEAHGTFASATCTICGSRKEGSEVKDSIFKDRLPKCLKRGCPGIVKPDIVFFGEDLPQRFYLYLRDMLQTDLVIVMGTSLEVQPFAGIIDTVKYGVPRVLFNWNAVGPFRAGKRAQDVVAAGDLISSLQKFAEMTGWKTEIEELIISKEGSFRICCPEYAKRAANRPKNAPKKPAPITNAFWRSRQESSSEEESSDSETESSSDSEEDARYKHESFRRRGVRSTGSMKNNMGTAQIKNGQNRLLNDVKKNGLNGSGQKRDFSNRVPINRSPAPNSSYNSKNMNGRYSAMNARPPSGRFGYGKTSSANPPSTEEKTKGPPEKLAPLSLKNKIDRNNSNENKKIIGSNSARGNTSDIRKSPSFSKEINTSNKNMVNGKVKTNSIETPVNSAATFNLKDTAVPSLDRNLITNVNKNDSRGSVDKNLNSTSDILIHNDSVLGLRSINNVKTDSKIEKNSGSVQNSTSNNNQESNSIVEKNSEHVVNADISSEHLSSTQIVDDIKDGIEKLNLKPVVDSKAGIENVVKDVVNSSVKSPLLSDLLLSTRSEPVFSNIRTIKPENSKPKTERIKTIKSESAIGANVKVETKTMEKKTEKFKRSKSEKNLRKKEKEKRRSVSAKAKVNLKLIHNRYAKNVKSASPQTTITEKDEVIADTPSDEINDESYINLIGTLKRERPLDVRLNMVDNSERSKSNVENFESESSSSAKCECSENETVEKLNEQISDLSIISTLPDENQLCSDSEKSTEGHRKKRLFKKPPKHKKKFDNASKELTSTLNPLPYGYATPRYKRLTGRGIVPPNVCGSYELPTQFSSQLLQKLGSGNHVKLTYRHSLKSSPAVRSKVIVREDSANSEIVDKAVDTGIC